MKKHLEFYRKYQKQKKVFVGNINFNNPRNQVIINMIYNIDIGKIKILSIFNKRKFFSLIIKREFLINDFFISIYDTRIYDQKNYSGYNFIQRNLLFFYDYVNFKFSRYILADTKTHLKYWEELFGKTKAETFILPVFANNRLYKPDNKPEVLKNNNFKLLFYGGFTPLHGVDKLIDAIYILKHLKLELTLIGNGIEFNNVIQKISNYNLFDKIKIIERFIPENELIPYINNADLILGIFGNSKKAKSVIANKVYQGLAMKKCVITMDSPGIREFFNDSEICLVENNPEKISEGILNLYYNYDKLNEIAYNGHIKYKKLYNTKKEEFINFLKRINKGDL